MDINLMLKTMCECNAYCIWVKEGFFFNTINFQHRTKGG